MLLGTVPIYADTEVPRDMVYMGTDLAAEGGGITYWAHPLEILAMVEPNLLVRLDKSIDWLLQQATDQFNDALAALYKDMSELTQYHYAVLPGGQLWENPKLRGERL